MKKKRNIKEIEYLFPKIKGFIQEIFGDRLSEVLLYGSFADNRATDDSDIDIAVILKDDRRVEAEQKKLNDFIAELGLESNELISILPLCSKEIENSKWPLYESLQESGIRL